MAEYSFYKGMYQQFKGNPLSSLIKDLMVMPTPNFILCLFIPERVEVDD